MPRSGRKNLLAGLFTLALGGFVVWNSAGYRIGSLTAMGPGFFPLVLGIILVLIALGIVVGGLRGDEGFAALKLRPLLIIPGAIAMFALLVDRIGFVVPAFLTMMAAGLADRQADKKALVVLAVVLVAAAYAIFAIALGMPVRLLMWNP
jgi:hypothetical protein